MLVEYSGGELSTYDNWRGRMALKAGTGCSKSELSLLSTATRGQPPASTLFFSLLPTLLYSSQLLYTCLRVRRAAGEQPTASVAP